MLALLDLAESIESGATRIDPRASRRKVLGIDTDIPAHNRGAMEAHPMFSRIQIIEGSSTEQDVIDQVHEIARSHTHIMAFLDSITPKTIEHKLLITVAPDGYLKRVK